MFEIKKTQLEQLASLKEKELIERLIDEVYSKIDEAKIVSITELEQELKFQSKKARFYGILSDRNVGIFMFSAFVLGKNFDTHYPIFAFLNDKQMDENIKCTSLENFTKLIINTLAAS